MREFELMGVCVCVCEGVCMRECSRVTETVGTVNAIVCIQSGSDSIQATRLLAQFACQASQRVC